MSALGTYVATRWYRRFPMPVRVGVRIGVGGAREAVRNYDMPRLALSLAMVAYGYSRRRAAPRLVYATSIDTDQHRREANHGLQYLVERGQRLGGLGHL